MARPATFIREQNLTPIRGGFFDATEHCYFDSRMQAVPGVTATLNNTGIVCYDHIPRAILEHKGEIGTAAHAATHYYDEGDLDDSTVDNDVFPYLEAWKKFRRENKLEIHAIEQRGIAVVDSMIYGYTFDRDVTFQGLRTLLEIKCTAGIEISWGIQLAAYEIPLRAIDGKVRRRLAVHLKPNGTYSLITFDDTKDYQIWKLCLALENWKQTKGRKNHGYGSQHYGR